MTDHQQNYDRRTRTQNQKFRKLLKMPDSSKYGDTSPTTPGQQTAESSYMASKPASTSASIICRDQFLKKPRSRKQNLFRKEF